MELQERQFKTSTELYKSGSIRFPQASELRGSKIGSGAKSTSKSAVIVKAAIVGDVRHWPIRFDEQAGSGGQPGLHDQLVGGDAKDAFD
jgi:hypothetical protein